MATTKARRSFGNVRKLPSGRWQAWYRRDGQRFTAEDTFRTKTEADTYLTTVRADLVRGQWVDTRRGLVTFGDYAETWFERRRDDVRRPLAPTTASKYRRLLDAYVLPEFKHRQIAQVTAEQVKQWHDGIAREHPSTAADAYRMLATMFNAAIKVDKIISHSPCELEGATSARVAERPTATPQEAQAAFDATPDRYRLALMLAAWCQLRRGEILGLQRADVDLVAESITIKRAWLVTSDAKKVLGPPKSDAGRRTVYMPPMVLEAMTAHLEQHTGRDADAWLFEHNGKPVLPRQLERVWERAREKAGRTDLHLHDLRHSGLTWAAQTGATTAELMRQAGHASPAAAIRYQHAADDRAKELASRLGRMAPNGAR